MKHWFFYLRISKEDFKEIPLFDRMFRVNDVDLLCQGRTSSIRSIGSGLTLTESEDGEYLYGLYAWSCDPETVKLFKERRNPKYFTCTKQDIMESIEWDALRSQYHSCEIMRVSYSDDEENNYSIPMTKFESDIVCDDVTGVTASIVDQAIMERNAVRKPDDSMCIPIDILSTELFRALDLLSWSEIIMEYGFMDGELSLTEYRGSDDSDDLDVLMDMYYNNLSYKIGLSGGIVSDYTLDPVSAYIFMLGDLVV